MNLKIARYYYENKLSLENGARYISTAYYSVKPGHLQSKNKSTINLRPCKKKIEIVLISHQKEVPLLGKGRWNFLTPNKSRMIIIF